MNVNGAGKIQHHSHSISPSLYPIIGTPTFSFL